MIDTDPFAHRRIEAAAHDCGALHDSLCLDLIRRHLRTETVGQRLCLYGDVPSTNAVLRHLAQAGAAEGTAVLAEEQSRGRGRPGKAWFSPPGLNLYVSVLLRPTLAVKEVPVFSFIASLALSETLWGEGLPGLIKWPNDVVIEGRKVAGTLVECADRDGRGEFVILGMGVNLNVTDDALRAELSDAARGATSVSEAAGREIDRNAFTAALLNRLERWLQTYRARGPAAVLAAWRERDALAGHRIEIRGNGAPTRGRAVGVGEDGSLEVQEADGTRRHLVAGEIRLLD